MPNVIHGAVRAGLYCEVGSVLVVRPARLFFPSSSQPPLPDRNTWRGLVTRSYLSEGRQPPERLLRSACRLRGLTPPAQNLRTSPVHLLQNSAAPPFALWGRS